MQGERWQQIAELYHAALDRDPSERASFLAEASGDDVALRDEVASLLAQETAPGPLDGSILEAAGELLDIGTELPAGTRLGPYEIDRLLGVGGMGEVYQAHDLKLERSVALKVLPGAFAADAERLARFHREARILASLNHPHIAAIYGFEEGETSSPADGDRNGVHVRALALELVEGPTLAARIARGPIPLDEALAIAAQIAEALRAAHQQGITHRDLKPANVKLRSDGTVKVLDFGLAKLADAASEDDGATPLVEPTISPITTTAADTLLGTAPYMSPEQATRATVDMRSDLWAFGCLFYEMLAGKRAFEGENVPEVLAKVLKAEPDWKALPADTPAPIRRLIERCLVKDRRQRIADISIALYVIEELSSPRSSTIVADAGTHEGHEGKHEGHEEEHEGRWGMSGGRLLTAGLAVVAAVVLTSVVVWLVTRPRAREAQQPARFEILTPANQPLSLGPLRSVAISVDGSHLVYRAGTGNQASLVVRPLNELEGRPLANTTGASDPFFSPDGLWIGFVGSGQLQKTAVTGGPALLISRVGAPPRGASWGPDDTIIFASADPASGLLSVPAAGGTPTILTVPDRANGELDHWFPRVLPDGRRVLFTIVAEPRENNQIAVLDLATGRHQILIRGGSQAEYITTGHLVYAAAGTMHVAGFDPVRLQLASDPIALSERVMTTNIGVGQFAVSQDGTLVYILALTSAQAAASRSLVWVDRRGTEQPINAPPRAYMDPRLSPDETRLAIGINDRSNSVWVWDLRRETLMPLDADSRSAMLPVWYPDGRRIIFASERDGSPNLYWRMADGSGVVERLTNSASPQFPSSIFPDGRRIFVAALSPNTQADVGAVVMDGRGIETLIAGTAQEFNPAISPDGQWLAYQSNESGQYEIYVRPFPDVNGARWPISAGGGTRPAWARNGRELFYLDSQNRLTAVVVHTTNPRTFEASKPVLMMEAQYFSGGLNYGRDYDVSASGRFLMIKDNASPDQRPAPAKIVVVQHWLEALADRQPPH